MFKKLEIIMSLFAGIILLIMGYIYSTPLLELSVKLLITMVVFYIMGFVIKKYFTKTVFKDDKPNGEDGVKEQDKEEKAEVKNAEDAEDMQEQETMQSDDEI